MVDAKYRFIYVCVGANDQETDGGVWGGCDVGQMLEAQEGDGEQVLPGPEPLPGSAGDTPHVIVGDEAFPLRRHLLRPFPGSPLTTDERRVFNYRLGRARRTSENAFGIMAQRWRVYRGPIGCSVATTKQIVQATCVLHDVLCGNELARGGLAGTVAWCRRRGARLAALATSTDVGATHNQLQDARHLSPPLHWCWQCALTDGQHPPVGAPHASLDEEGQETGQLVWERSDDERVARDHDKYPVSRSRLFDLPPPSDLTFMSIE